MKKIMIVLILFQAMASALNAAVDNNSIFNNMFKEFSINTGNKAEYNPVIDMQIQDLIRQAMVKGKDSRFVAAYYYMNKQNPDIKKALLMYDEVFKEKKDPAAGIILGFAAWMLLGDNKDIDEKYQQIQEAFEKIKEKDPFYYFYTSYQSNKKMLEDSALYTISSDALREEGKSIPLIIIANGIFAGGYATKIQDFNKALKVYSDPYLQSMPIVNFLTAVILYQTKKDKEMANFLLTKACERQNESKFLTSFCNSPAVILPNNASSKVIQTSEKKEKR